MKKVLFVCIENSCRSQMAEAFAKELGKGIIEAYSAGSKPLGKVNPSAIAVMKEVGIDISNANSKGFDQLALKSYNYVVTLGCQDTCPFIPAKNHISWEIDDPKGKELAYFRKVRDEIKNKVERFIERIAYIQNWK
ncbi:MAG: arsenate reductase ArsC [Candidatus Omnitrophota bacterium]